MGRQGGQRGQGQREKGTWSMQLTERAHDVRGDGVFPLAVPWAQQ